jgi:hypothetical protein
MANTKSEAKSFAHTADVSTMSHLLLEIMENKPLFAEIQRLEFSRKFYEHHRDWWVHLYPFGRLCQKILDLRDSGTGTEAHKRMLDNDLQQGREELREAWKTLREHWAAQKNEKRISLGVYNALTIYSRLRKVRRKGCWTLLRAF